MIKRDDKNMTNVPGIFVAGDMARGASLVVHAISNGMQTGRDVFAYLNE
jgi:glutamate synthase (NADPH/NADH) small chain